MVLQAIKFDRKSWDNNTIQALMNKNTFNPIRMRKTAKDYVVTFEEPKLFRYLQQEDLRNGCQTRVEATKFMRIC